jgi:hypothetical protein
MMIELKDCGFALLATVLSFIADYRDTQESIRWRLGSPANSGREFSKTGDHPSLVGFRDFSPNSADTDQASDPSPDEMLV